MSSLHRCPKCEADDLPEQDYCPYCGSHLRREPWPGWVLAVRILLILGLVVVACPSALIGGFLVISAAFDPSEAADRILAGSGYLLPAGALFALLVLVIRAR